MIFLERRLRVEFVATTFEILYTARIHTANVPHDPKVQYRHSATFIL